MKKLLFPFAFLLFAFVAKAQSFPSSVSVNEYGFMVFPTVTDLDDYVSLIKSSTHAQVQSLLSSQHFSSLGASLYIGRAYSNTT